MDEPRDDIPQPQVGELWLVSRGRYFDGNPFPFLITGVVEYTTYLDDYDGFHVRENNRMTPTSIELPNFIAQLPVNQKLISQLRNGAT